MNDIKFNYISYNDKTNFLLVTLKKYVNNRNLIITQDSMAKKFFSTSINQKKLEIFQNIFSIEELWEKIFFSNKYILGDIKAFFAFYFSLNEEIKKKLKIKSYFDSIEYANDFFSFFENIKTKEELKKIEFSKWQKERFEIFFEIKNDFDIFLENNNYILENWLYTPENLDLSFLEKYDKIIFYDVLSFPKNFDLILNELRKKINVEIVLQMKKNDFDEKNMKIKNISIDKSSNKLVVYEYKNDFELYNIISAKRKNLDKHQFFSPYEEYNDNYSCFETSKKSIFNDTKLYQVLEVYINILDELNDKNIDLFKLKKNIFKSSFMEFYGLDKEDYNTFNQILENDYRYISLEILENGTYNFYFKENKNLYEKLKEILKNVELIENLKSIEDLNNFFKEKFFSNDENIKFFIENKYSSIYDKFYEILGILHSNENNNFFNGFLHFFKNNVGKNIFLLFFTYLNNITLYIENEEILDIDFYLKDLYTAKYFDNNQKENILIGADNLSLPKLKKKNNLFTEQQKSILGIDTSDYEILVEKYRTFQNLLSLPELDIYSLVDLDNNIEISSFISDFISNYDYVSKEVEINFTDMLLPTEAIKLDEAKYRPFKKERNDFKNSILKIGAYDYILLKNNETFFFLNKLCSIDSSQEIKETNGISAKILGIILHKTLENIFKEKWKEILSSTENLLIDANFIENSLRKNFNKEKLKIESFINSYQEEIIIPRLVKNITNFFKILYEELKNEKILRVDAEKNDKKEIPFLTENSIDVFLTGRADLVIETDNSKYIIDLKTGSYKKEQLEFYSVMFAGNKDKKIYSSAYNFWNEEEANYFNFSNFLVTDIEKLETELKEKLSSFLSTNYYKLPKKSQFLENDFDFNQYYNYKNICHLDKIVQEEGEE